MQTITPSKKTRIELTSFLGVDYANDETEVDIRRSPHAPNITADLAGRPVLRPGYETVLSYEGEQIYGIHFHDDLMLLHHGSTVTAYLQEDGDFREVAEYQGANRQYSESFYMDGATYLLDGKNYFCFDGIGFEDVAGYVPTTTIAAPPSGGGTALESVNLLTPKRINTFTADGISTDYQLDAAELDAEEVRVSIDGSALTEDTDFTVDREQGIVHFQTAPPEDNGVDSVSILFAKTVPGYREKIAKCTKATAYGLGNDTRVFVTGNPEEPNVDYQSGLYDPTYFPDLGYTRIGTDHTRIMGYIKQYGELIIVKEEADGIGGLYKRVAEMLEDGSVIFPVYEGIQGTGAVSMRCFATINGDPMFFAENGVFGLSSNAVTNQQSIQLRSWYINPALIREHGKDRACAAAWGRNYVLALNDSLYVANTEAKNGNKTQDFGYEWYHWTDIPARVLKVNDNRLYFGTEDGRVCRFKEVSESGMECYSDDGRGINAMWTTPLLDGGNFLQYKSISKKGTGILAKPYARSGGEIFFTTDRSMYTASNRYTMDILDFDDIDFNRFTFNLRDNPQVCISPKKFRKVLSFQMGVKHTAPNESFGILGMMITFTPGKMTRRNSASAQQPLTKVLKLQNLTAEPTEETQTFTPEIGFDGIRQVDVSGVKTKTLTIGANGIYNAPQGVYYKTVMVNVPIERMQEKELVWDGQSELEIRPDVGYLGLSKIVIRKGEQNGI